MGGIWKKIPFTYAYMWLGSLALAGLPLFAGYYSKDMILESAWADHSMHAQVAFWLGIAAAVMTAFYSWRLLFMTFHGKPRASQEVMDHIHESPPVMLVPLIVLAIGSLAAGAVGYYSFGMVSGTGGFWRGSIAVLEANNTLKAAHHVPDWVAKLPIAVALLGIAAAWYLYIRRTALPAKIAGAFRPVYLFLLNKWYFDELYQVLFVRGTQLKGRLLWKIGDVRLIDGLGPNGVAWVSRRVGALASRLQSGLLYHYAFAMLLGLVAFVSWLLWSLPAGAGGGQ